MCIRDSIRIIPAGEAKVGDVLMVRPGDRIPLDSVVTEGESRIDTSPITGEPVPIKAAAGTEVVSGCVNEHGLLKIKVTRPLTAVSYTHLDVYKRQFSHRPFMGHSPHLGFLAVQQFLP